MLVQNITREQAGRNVLFSSEPLLLWNDGCELLRHHGSLIADQLCVQNGSFKLVTNIAYPNGYFLNRKVSSYDHNRQR